MFTERAAREHARKWAHNVVKCSVGPADAEQFLYLQLWGRGVDGVYARDAANEWADCILLNGLTEDEATAYLCAAMGDRALVKPGVAKRFTREYQVHLDRWEAARAARV